MASLQRKVALVDDHSLFRSGLRGLLGSRNYCVVGEFADGTEFVRALPRLDVEVVFMDISMPTMGGYEATIEALKIAPDLKVIVLSMFGDEHYYSRMVEAGARGFLLKDSSIDEVEAAIESVCRGEDYICDSLLDSLSRRLRSASNATLSEREADVIVGICQGLSTQQIADTLFISKRTVDAHRANILEKTGCKNTAQLVVYAIKHNIIEI